MRHPLAALVLATAPALAETPMSADEFESYVRGKTLFYSAGGFSYGAEQYLPGRRVIWTFLDGTCQEGMWYEEDGLICFVYTEEPAPQCWSFWRRPGGLGARFQNDPEGSELYETRQSEKPLVCPGPDVGA